MLSSQRPSAKSPVAAAAAAMLIVAAAAGGGGVGVVGALYGALAYRALARMEEARRRYWRWCP